MKYVSVSEFKVSKNRDGLGVRKDFASTAEDIGNRTLRFTISTSSPDRSNDVVNQDGWQLDFYKRNPVVLWNHTTEQLPVGKCISIGIEDGALKATVEFIPSETPVAGPFADAVYQLCKTGFLSATSVGFLPIDFKETDDEARGAGTWSAGIDFNECQLIEFSIVCTPDNPEALIEPNQVELTPTDAPKITADDADKNSQINIMKRERRARQLQLRERTFANI